MRLTKLYKCIRSEDGQALAEFAVVFPVQLFITLAIVQLALITEARDVVDYAAHAAARAELTGEDPTRAAAMICSSITGPTLGTRQVRMEPGFGTPVNSEPARYATAISFPDWRAPLAAAVTEPEPDIQLPGWGRLKNSGVALLKTHAEVLDPFDANADFVEVRILHEYELPIPFVNWFFSSHRIGGVPHLGIVKTARVPKPWSNDRSRGGHPLIPDLNEEDHQ